MDAHEVIARCRRLAECTEEPGHITRTFLSPPMREVHALAGAWMRSAGLQVRVDAAGNLRGACGEGSRLMIGSHLDTVPHAGAFDGILGVMMGIALAGRRPLEVAGFSEEEGVRFGTPFIGSRALVGDPVTGSEVLGAIREFGLDPDCLPDALLSPDVRGYLEFHIEQGPVLESLDLPLAVVEAVAGQSRFEVCFTGKANHAGTTPMHLRRDALAGAAEWIGLVEREGATVGWVEAEPGATNVIAGSVRASLDVRHARDGERRRIADCLLQGARELAHRRGLTVEWEQKLDQPAVDLRCDQLERAVEAAGYPVHRMVSGAGHDAMILARKVPSALLFLRSPGGISHHPDEAVLPADVEAALAVGAKYLEAWRPE
ncbi:MAG TPA: Zn-dependent hydrolase [Candidatus Acidoferrales bacterium]|nr:Zn-dependent hydrolase [Candidatus Acidoferrales bacterium]